MKNVIFNKIKKNRHNILVVIMIIAILLSYIIYKKYLNVKTTYTVVNGYVEKSTNSVGVILKDETVVELNNNDVAVPVIEQNKRIAKGDIIAVYKDEQYEEYINSINELDKTIQTLIVDLPASYYNDVSTIENKITEFAKNARGETSYVKMQEYKNKIDELLYKKVLILGERSPEGAKVRELIEQRENIERNSAAIGTNNIFSPVSGIVSYKIDGLESLVNIDNIFNYNITELDDIISKYTNSNSSNFGVKVVDNYLAYILIKEEKGKNEEYIEVDKNYSLKFNEDDIGTITAKLKKVVTDDKYNYIIFELDNRIENLMDLRTSNMEIVWEKVTGMAVPTKAISKNEEKEYNYVTLVYGTQYVEVPIKVSIESDNICIVENLSKEEKEKLGINTTFILELYDKLVI